MQIRKETVSIWDYKADNNINIANFECLWETRIRRDLCLNPACEEIPFLLSETFKKFKFYEIHSQCTRITIFEFILSLDVPT